MHAHSFESLRVHFVQGLSARAQQIEATRHDPTRCAAVLHQLTGAAGSYGFPELSDCARQAEQAALHQDFVSLERHLLALQNIIAQIITSVRCTP